MGELNTKFLGQSTPIGQIFNSDAWSGWVVTGTAAWVPSGSDVLASGGVAGTYTNRYQFDSWTTCLEKHKMILRFQITTIPSAITSGIAVGIRSVNTLTKISYLAVLNCSDTGASGNVTIQVANNAGATTFTSLGSTTSLGAVALNDEIVMTVTKNYLNVTVLTQNITQGTSSTVSFNDVLTSPSFANQWHNTGRVCLYIFGGTYTIHQVNYSTDTPKFINCLAVGDSITVGFFAGTEGQTFFNRLFFRSNVENVRYGGSGDKTAEILLRIPEILLIRPKYVMLMIGTNDIRSAIALATIKSNYLSIYNQLTVAGIKVICCYVPPTNSFDITPINLWITSTLNPFTIIENTFFSLKSNTAFSPEPSFFAADLVHPNSAGSVVLAQEMRKKVPYLY